MKNLMVRLKTCVIIFFLASQLGCATTFDFLESRQEGGEKRLLDFLEDGKTTKDEVSQKLGVPSNSYEKGQVLTYRIGIGKNDGYVITAYKKMDWSGTKFSLVLVFDENGVLRKHSMVSVR